MGRRRPDRAPRSRPRWTRTNGWTATACVRSSWNTWWRPWPSCWLPGTERYEFLADQVHQLGPRFCFPVDQVLADAEQRLTTWRSISTTLPSTGTRIRRSPTLPRDSVSESLSAVEWQVVSAMPTEGTVAEVIAVSGLSAFTVFDVLHRLVRRGLVQPVGEDAAAP